MPTPRAALGAYYCFGISHPSMHTRMGYFRRSFIRRDGIQKRMSKRPSYCDPSLREAVDIELNRPLRPSRASISLRNGEGNEISKGHKLGKVIANTGKKQAEIKVVASIIDEEAKDESL